MDLFFFVLLASSLVLVHELGHFLAARAFGVKVLTFSLGFGPPLLKYRGRETTYQLGWLPFGGFVRLLETPADGSDTGLAPADQRRTYDGQPVLRRAIIALAGPAMNVLVPFFLFFALDLDPGPQLPPTVGTVVTGGAADGVLRAGDRVLAVDGIEVATYGELQAKIAASAGTRIAMRVARPGDSGESILDVGVTPSAVTDATSGATVGRLGIGPSPLAAAIGVPGPASPAHRAGLRSFDVITHVGGVPTPRLVDLERRLAENVGTAVPINYLRPAVVAMPPEGGPLLEFAVHEARVALLAPEPREPGGPAGIGDGLRRAGIEPIDLYVASVPEGSSEWRAGLRPGDRVRAVDGREVASWPALVDDLVSGQERTRELSWTRDGRAMSGLLRVRKEEWTDPSGEHVERFVFRSTHWSPTVPLAPIAHPAPLGRAVRLAAAETARVVRFIATSLVDLIRGRTSVRAISGPITIYDVAGRAGARGAREFLWVMALISINLGLLNLLPIPTLDGGQLAFLVVERIAGRPLPLRARQIASAVGLASLLVLMVVAFRNDLLRR
jgi:regulator of sigma E protease